MENVNMAFCSDEKNITFLAVALKSIIDNASNERIYNVYIVHNGISEYDRGSLLLLVRNNLNFHLSFINIGKYAQVFSTLFVSGHIPHAAYWRFALPEILEHVDKLIYLDTDVVVIDDIAKLYDENFAKGEVLAGSPGIGVSAELPMTKPSREVLKRYGYVNFKRYINTGVLLINMREFRSEMLFQKFIETASGENFPMHDQDVINLVLMDRIKMLDWKWNFAILERFDDYPTWLVEDIKTRIAILDISIVHYVGCGKPWICFDRPLADLWFMYAERTPFYAGMKIRPRRNDNIICDISKEKMTGRKSKIISKFLHKVKKH